MAPPLPPKPKSAPLVVRSLAASTALLSIAGCAGQNQMRDNPPVQPPRPIEADEIIDVEQQMDAGAPTSPHAKDDSIPSD